MERNVVLVGFMATGKTEVGKIVSKRLARTFVDIDDDIIKDTGMNIGNIFETYGEEFFRDLESHAIQKRCEMTNLVIATGGGSLLRVENVESLKRTGILICLTASPEEILRRVGDERHRPLLNVADKLSTIRGLMDQRKRSYACADIMIDTEGRSPHETAEQIILRLSSVLKDENDKNQPR
jgi:shikimate kinase